MLSDKFIAGFTDADGCITLDVRPLQYSPDARPQLKMSWTQKKVHSFVLHEIQGVFGGTLRERDRCGSEKYTELTLSGSDARGALQRLSPYLVIKKGFAEFCIKRMSVKGIRDGNREPYLTARRTLGKIPNFPSRKWLAGYFDGDGCLNISRLSQGGSAHIRACITCSDYDAEGITTIQKNFGGHIRRLKNGRSNLLEWNISLNPSKAVDFLGYFNSHSVVKRDQVDYILSLARMGHFNDGERIQQELKRLKTVPTSRD